MTLKERHLFGVLPDQVRTISVGYCCRKSHQITGFCQDYISSNLNCVTRHLFLPTPLLLIFDQSKHFIRLCHAKPKLRALTDGPHLVFIGYVRDKLDGKISQRERLGGLIIASTNKRERQSGTIGGAVK